MKKTNRKNAKTRKTPVKNCKDVSMPLNDTERAIIKKWSEGEDENSLAIRFKAELNSQHPVIASKTASDRGDDLDKYKLICAGLCAATGAKNTSFANRLFKGCVYASGLLEDVNLEVCAHHCAAISDALHAIWPQDESEGMSR